MKGEGCLYNPSNLKVYQGEWVDGYFHGKGTLFNERSKKLTGSFDYSNFDKLEDYWTTY